MAQEIKKRWYVVRAISGKEKKVKEYIEMEVDRMKMTDYVAQILIPTEKVFQIRTYPGKKFLSLDTFFPFLI